MNLSDKFGMLEMTRDEIRSLETIFSVAEQIELYYKILGIEKQVKIVMNDLESVELKEKEEGIELEDKKSKIVSKNSLILHNYIKLKEFRAILK